MTDQETNLWRDAFRYYDKYSKLPMEADDFSSAAQDMAENIEKHGSVLLAKDLFYAVYTHLGNRWREEQRRKDGNAEQTKLQMVAEAQSAPVSDAP